MSSRYTIIGTLASGGMGTVFLARMTGSAGFSRLVAIKRLHPELAAQREFIAMLVDEARLASQVRHVNVIDTLDLVASDGAFSVVLEYVEGPSLSGLVRAQLRQGGPVPQPIALAVISGMLRGLDAAHEARGAEGQPLGIVHRDVSPQNVLVGVDGIPRIIDFGIAKAMGRVASTRPGEVRGKFAYMAPEQLLERPATRQVDVYAAGVCLWEMLTGERLFKFEDQRAVASAVMRGDIKVPSTVNPAIPPELDAIIMQATARETSERFLTAREMLDAIAPFKRASEDEVGMWVRELAAEFLAKRAGMLQSVHSDHSRSVEDLLAELAQSATPPSARIPAALPVGGPFSVAPTLPVQEMPSFPSAHGLTGTGMSVPAGVPAHNTKLLFFLLPAACVAGLLIVGAIILGVKARTGHVSATMPPPATSVAPPPPLLADPLNPPVVTSAPPLEPVVDSASAAPSGSVAISPSASASSSKHPPGGGRKPQPSGTGKRSDPGAWR